MMFDYSNASQFTGLLGVSAIFDIIWMIKNDQNGLIKILTVVLLLLKVRVLFHLDHSLIFFSTRFQHYLHLLLRFVNVEDHSADLDWEVQIFPVQLVSGTQ